MADNQSAGCSALTVLLLLLMVSFGGCTGLPEDFEKSSSSALSDNTSTTLGNNIAEIAATHPGESGFVLLRY
ncbi:MAG: hypothetical protein AAGF57_16625, partial [Pseudomonadota bacterium]